MRDLGDRKSRDPLVGVKSDFLKVTASRLPHLITD